MASAKSFLEKARAEQKKREKEHAKAGYSKSDAAKARVENVGRTYGTSSKEYRSQKKKEKSRGHDISKPYEKKPNFAFEEGDYIDPKTGKLLNVNVTGDFDMAGQGIPTRPGGLAPYSGGGKRSATSESDFDVQGYLDKIAKVKTEAGVSALKKSAESALGALGQERGQVEPAFREARTGVKTQAELGKRSVSDFLASKGLGGGAQLQGTEAQSEIASNVQLGGALSGLQQQEAQTLSDIARRESDIKSGLASDIAAVEAGAEATALDRALQLQLADRERALGRADVLERREYEAGLAEQERGRLAEEQAFQAQLDTLGQYAGNYQDEIDRRMALDPSDPLIPYLQMARQHKIQSQNLDPVTGQPLQTGVDLTPSQAMQLWAITGRATPDVARALGVSEGDNYSTYAQRNRGTGGGTSRPDIPSKGETWSVWENVKGNDPTLVDQYLKANAQTIINSVGKSGYDEMVLENADRLKAKERADTLLGGIGNLFGR